MQSSHLKLRVVLLRSLLFALALTGRTATAASIEFYIPPIGTNLPLESASWGILNYFPLSGQRHHASANVIGTGSIGRTGDGYSPALANAVIKGTPFPTATLHFCMTDCSSPTTYLWLTLQNVVLTSYSPGSSSGGGSLFESIGFTYSSMTATYVKNNAPPPDVHTAWGWMLPADLPVGRAEPYAFAFDINATVAEVLFNRSLSSLGDGMSATLFSPDVAPVPLPAAAWLLLSGLGGLGFIGRRKAA